MRTLLMLLCACLTTVGAIAQNQGDALKARDEALQALKGFNPGSVINGYSSNPQEIALAPNEDSNALSGQGLAALSHNQTANEVYREAGSRNKVRNNPQSPEMHLAETLLEHPDEVLEGVCYKQASDCELKTTTKTCDESVQYASEVCRETLHLTIKTITQSFTRTVPISRHQASVVFDLQHCPSQDPHCSLTSVATLAPFCEQLLVEVKRKNKRLVITRQPTCTDTAVEVQLPGSGQGLLPLNVTVTEKISEEHWQRKNCSAVPSHYSGGCFLSDGESCVKPDTVKIIDGIQIKRPCWEREYRYQCAQIAVSSCTPFIESGCRQTASVCLEAKNNRCERYSQIFQCAIGECPLEKTVCPGVIPCADGQCDPSSHEVSDDIAEGLSQLGALAGVAGNVADNQIKSGMPAIFTGKAQECKKYPIGLRDCCTDSGWGDWIKHCPQELQALQLAKQENRVVYLGHYINHKLGARHYVYCLFPSKLAAIIQIQGRGGQLKIPYGSAEYPDCRGLTPEELARINFSSLDLSPIQKELIARMSLPANGSIAKANESHIEQLKQQGRAHD